MKRALMGVLWFVVFFVALYVAACLVVALYLRGQLPSGTNPQQAMDLMQQFMYAHAAAVSAGFWALVLAALFAAVFGTFKGMLPGTKPKPRA